MGPVGGAVSQRSKNHLVANGLRKMRDVHDAAQKKS
jgi:hypothetical protein